MQTCFDKFRSVTLVRKQTASRIDISSDLRRLKQTD